MLAVRLLLELGQVDQDRRPAIGEGDPDLALRLDHARPELRKIEVVVEGHVVDELHVLRMEVVPEAGHRGLRGVDGARLLVAALEYAHLLAGPGQVGGRAEPVVAAADDHRVVASVRHLRPPSCSQ